MKKENFIIVVNPTSEEEALKYITNLLGHGVQFAYSPAPMTISYPEQRPEHQVGPLPF